MRLDLITVSRRALENQIIIQETYYTFSASSAWLVFVANQN